MIEVYAVNVRKIKELADGKIIHFSLKSVRGIKKYSIGIDKNGKPKLLNVPNLYFNISHSGDWVFCAFSDFEIGIDVEKIEDAKMNVAKKYYNKLEYEKLNCIDNVIERNELFYLLWTLKESYLKNMGMSIGML